MEDLERIGQQAKKAEAVLRTLSRGRKDAALNRAADRLDESEEQLLSANEKDRMAALEKGMSQGLLDRLTLTRERIRSMSQGLRDVAALDDPVGEVTGMKRRPNGLLIGQKRVPLGVVGIIYEARPNVTADAFGLCFKAGNAVILKGGSDAAHSNAAIVSAAKRAGRRKSAAGGCLPSYRRPVADHPFYEDERICGCADPKRRRQPDSYGGTGKHGSRH